MHSLYPSESHGSGGNLHQQARTPTRRGWQGIFTTAALLSPFQTLVPVFQRTLTAKILTEDPKSGVAFTCYISSHFATVAANNLCALPLPISAAAELRLGNCIYYDQVTNCNSPSGKQSRRLKPQSHLLGEKERH